MVVWWVPELLEAGVVNEERPDLLQARAVHAQHPNLRDARFVAQVDVDRSEVDRSAVVP